MHYHIIRFMSTTEYKHHQRYFPGFHVHSFFLPKSRLFYSLLRHQLTLLVVSFRTMCNTPYFFHMSINTGTSSTKIAGHHLKIVGMDANDHGHSFSKTGNVEQ